MCYGLGGEGGGGGGGRGRGDVNGFRSLQSPTSKGFDNQWNILVCVSKYALRKIRKDLFPPFFGVFGGETRILEPPFINAIPIPAGKNGNAAMDLLLGIRQKGKI